MKIRDAEKKDAKQLDMLLTRLIRDESKYDNNLNSDCEIKENYCNLIGLDGHKFILIEEDGEIIGYLYGFIYHIPDIHKSPTAILDALFIDEKYRRKGYASLLITEFRAFAVENGASQIELKVVSDNLSIGGVSEPVFKRIQPPQASFCSVERRQPSSIAKPCLRRFSLT